MPQIDLAQDEMEMLREILQKSLSEISLELAFSDRKDFREFLKKRKMFMEHFIGRLGKGMEPGRGETIRADRLRDVDIFQGLTEGELQRVAPLFEAKSVAAEFTLFEEGTRAERLYILEQGCVSLQSKKGRQYDLDTHGKVIGWSFLVPPFLYTASAKTKTPCEVLVIKSPDFYYLVHSEPEMGVKVIRNLAQVIASRLI